MTSLDLNKKLIYTTLTLNSTTLYTYENTQLIHKISNLNCSEIISQELGLINASKTLVGSMYVTTSEYVTNSSLLLYFMKKSVTNKDGSTDLLTVIAIANTNVNKILILSVLKKIIEKYISFKADIEKQSPTNDQLKAQLGKFKPFMNQIIKFEEMNYDTNNQLYEYGSNKNKPVDEESSLLYDSNVINPNQLILANEEVDEVRQLMLDNINKIMNRGDKINSLVDQTDRLNSSSVLFQKKAQIIRRKMWVDKMKLSLILTFAVILVLYLFLSAKCGFPLLDRCI